MTDHLSEPTESILGRHLLGHATDAEVRELQRRRQESPSLRRAMGLLDLSRTEFYHSPLGEELTMNSTNLPDYYRPEQLARSLRR